ncbi:MAG: hypothetical protein ACLQT5_10570 [Steroidobacteraceae bacterium]
MEKIVVQDKDLILRALKAKVPPMLMMFVEQRRFWTIFGLGLATLLLFGPVAGPHAPDHNGLRYLLAPWVCPWGAALYYAFAPFNPYKLSSLSRFSEMADYNKRDPDANRLVEVFRSAEARQTLFRITVRISIILFTVMMLISFIVRSSLAWSVSSYWVGQGLIACTIGTSIAVASEYVSWGVGSWASGQRDNQSAGG